MVMIPFVADSIAYGLGSKFILQAFCLVFGG